jgi:hypothetical protein
MPFYDLDDDLHSYAFDDYLDELQAQFDLTDDSEVYHIITSTDHSGNALSFKVNVDYQGKTVASTNRLTDAFGDATRHRICTALEQAETRLYSMVRPSRLAA